MIRKEHKMYWRKLLRIFHIHRYEIISTDIVKVGEVGGRDIYKSVKKCPCGKEKQIHIIKQ